MEKIVTEFDFKHFIDYFIKILRKEYILTRVMFRILIKLIKRRNPKLKKFALSQLINSIKMLVIFVVFALPMGSWIIILMIVLKFKYNINLLPGVFNKEEYLKSLHVYKNK
jgi:hypothetical protein